MKLYVVLLESLPSGAKLAQTAHAVSELHAARPEACEVWREASNTVVILAAGERALAELAFEPGAVEFREPDRGGERTAVALFPSSAGARKLLRRAALAA